MKSLERRLGLGAVLAISMSAMLGSGLFVLPGLAAAKTGPSVWLAYLCAGLCVLPAALSKAELATAMPTSGGTYVFLDRTFGPLAGTIAGLGLWASLLLKSAFALVGFGAYLSVFAAVPLKITALTLLVLVLLINVSGATAVGKLGKAVVGVVLLFVIGLTISAGLHYDPALLEDSFSHGSGGFLAAVGFVYVSYAGVTKVAAIAEEVKDPNRNLPLGMILSLLVMAGVYAAVTHMLVAVVPHTELATDLHPIYTMADRVAGPTIGLLAAILGVVMLTTMATAGVLATSRFPFAMSRDDLLPRRLGKVHERAGTPVNAILATGVIMAVAILFLDVEKIAKLASGFKILIFMFVNAAVIVLRESHARWYQPGFRAPLYPWLQIAGIVLGAALLVVMGGTAVVAIVGITVPGALFYAAYGRRRTSRRGVLGIFGRRKDLVPVPGRPPAETLEQVLPREASVFVPLFGTERSPETLVEIAVALAGAGKVEVLHITIVPEQLDLGYVLEEDPLTRSLRRRIEALAEEDGVDVEFDTTVSRDPVQTIHDVAERVHCEWTVMEWVGRTQTRIAFSNPIGWLQDHLPCNLAVFKDAGVRRIRQVLLNAQPGPHDALMVNVADRISQRYGAELSFVHHEQPDMDRKQLVRLAKHAQELAHRSVTRTGRHIVAAGPQEAEALARVAAGYDLLVTSPAHKRTLLDVLRGTTTDRLTRLAPCAVIWVKDPHVHDVAHDESVAVSQPFDLDAALEDRWIGVKVQVDSIEALFRRIADDFAASVAGADPVETLEALLERESLASTGMGEGVAIPHGAMATMKRTRLGVYTLAQPLPFNAPDGRDVDVLFVTVGPPTERETHLRVLGSVAHLAMTTTLLDELRLADTVDDARLAVRKVARPGSGIFPRPNLG